jgi:N-acetylglutamate synthase-like GNAT family acetyltransferase
MDKENPEFNLANFEFESISLEEKKQALREACLIFLAIHLKHPVDGSFDIEKEKAQYKLKAEIEQLENGVSPEEAMQIINETKKLILDIPESTFLSEKAFGLVQESWKKYRFIGGKYTDLTYELRNELLVLGWKAEDPKEDLIIALKDNRVVGFTRYNLGNDSRKGNVYVVYQKADAKYPGIGLGMLNNLIAKARDLNIKAIYVNTDRVPLGLGNLGFEFDEKKNYLMSSVVYKLDLVTEE